MSLRDQFLNGGGCRVIDAHGHLGPFYAIYMPEASLESMVDGIRSRNVESIILSPHACLTGDTREGNREMAEAAAAYPGLIYGYCTINPNFPADIEREMDTYIRMKGVVGFKIHPPMHSYPATGHRYKPMWERANSGKLMVLSHTWGKSGGCGADDMKQIAETYPNVRLLLGHSCHGAWEEAIALARDFPNVYLELTAAYSVYGLIEWMCRDAGSHKVLFGTDYPWFDPFVAVGSVVHARIADHEMENILWRNTRRLLDEQTR